MEVFAKSYLAHIVRTQGELFDSFARQNPTSDTDDFIITYMKSKTRTYIDKGQPYVCTMFAKELMSWFLASEGYKPTSGTAMTGFMPDWIGRFYALYQWTEHLSSAETLDAVPLSYLKSAYPGLHDLELDLAVAKVAPPVA